MEFLKKAEKLDVLPPIEEVFEDEWLENLRSTSLFSHFVSYLENKTDK